MSATAHSLSSNPPIPRLESLYPLNTLSSEHLRQLADAARVEKITPAKKLFVHDEHRWLLYLLNGSLLLRTADDAQMPLHSGTDAANNPLFEHSCKPVCVVSQSTSLILRVDKNLLKVLLEEERNTSTTVQEYAIDEAGEALFGRVYQAYVDRKMKLPSLPDIALKIREVVRNPELGIADIARVVQADPALTVRLIQVANSPAYHGTEPVSSALAAVSRLGASTTQNLAFVMAVSQLFHSQSAPIQKKMAQIYTYSTELAALCFVIASRCTELDRERAMLVGLVSHIGTIPLLHYASEDAIAVENSAAIDNLLTNLECVTTGLVLSHWGFDPEITHICESCCASHIVDVTQAITYCDVLLAAELISPSRHSASNNSELAFDDHPLQKKFAVAGVIESAGLFCQEMADEIEISRSLLSRS